MGTCSGHFSLRFSNRSFLGRCFPLKFQIDYSMFKQRQRLQKNSKQTINLRKVSLAHFAFMHCLWVALLFNDNTIDQPKSIDDWPLFGKGNRTSAIRFITARPLWLWINLPILFFKSTGVQFRFEFRLLRKTCSALSFALTLGCTAELVLKVLGELSKYWLANESDSLLQLSIYGLVLEFTGMEGALILCEFKCQLSTGLLQSSLVRFVCPTKNNRDYNLPPFDCLDRARSLFCLLARLWFLLKLSN